MVGLLDPLEIKGLPLRNRIVMPPMHTGLATAEGKVTDTLINHYVQRSKSVGLVIIEHSYVAISGKLTERQLGVYDDGLIEGLEKLSSGIHATGTPVVMQINHAGRSANKEITGVEPVAPSSGGEARELQSNEIEEIISAFGKAAERAMKAGFDGVEVHGAHGFLINQFFSPLTNKRQDKYGGSLDNRMRFPLEVVREVKRKIGQRLILYRLGAVDLDATGLQIIDSQKLAVKLEEVGVDILDVSGGLCGSRPAQLQSKQGYFVREAEQIKKVLRIPVIGVGGIKEPEYADMLIRKKRVDLVAVGRALLEDADWATKAVSGLKRKHP